MKRTEVQVICILFTDTLRQVQSSGFIKPKQALPNHAGFVAEK